MKQGQLFNKNELPIKLKRLTKEQVQDLAIKHFGNLLYYYEEQIIAFAQDIQKKIEGKNKHK